MFISGDCDRDPLGPIWKSCCQVPGLAGESKPGLLSVPRCITGSLFYRQKYGIFRFLKGTRLPLEGTLAVLSRVERR